ncbi:uncharacterized protein LOC103570372 [Microplitis demolitor]|uniref:uncharacterized protein LOC103570372 n=1 Tax=Microplitis demolitor TaxID=69319 RepID=UPI0004CD90FF|nr:uncharacterized protein LOC103570372 [Microplitis demolitor]
MATQMICLVVLLTAGLSQGQLFPDFDQFNPLNDNSEIPSSDSETTTAVNKNESTTEGSGNDDSQQSGDNPANIMTKVIDAAKETIEESFVKPGIKMGTALPRFGAKLMG